MTALRMADTRARAPGRRAVLGGAAALSPCAGIAGGNPLRVRGMTAQRPSGCSRRAALGGLLLLAAGCGPTRLAPLAGPAKGRVILLRGLANIFSTGLNTLTAELRNAGYDAAVYNHIDGGRLVEETVAAANAGTLVRPLVLIGHSLGADEVLRMAGELGARNLAVDLVITFDPTVIENVPAGPRRVVNFYQQRDPLSRRLAAGPGFSGTIENRLVQGESHLSIEKAARLHLEVLGLLAALRTPAAPVAATTHRPQPQAWPGRTTPPDAAPPASGAPHADSGEAPPAREGQQGETFGRVV